MARRTLIDNQDFPFNGHPLARFLPIAEATTLNNFHQS